MEHAMELSSRSGRAFEHWMLWEMPWAFFTFNATMNGIVVKLDKGYWN
jgi:hypothetical protein